MEKINAVAMIRKIRDQLYKETKDLKGDRLKKYYSKKSQWARSHKTPSLPVR
jgi:hypothetical protein